MRPDQRFECPMLQSVRIAGGKSWEGPLRASPRIRAVSSPTRFSTWFDSDSDDDVRDTIEDEINLERSVPVIPLREMDSDVSDTVSVDAQSIRDDEVPGPQSRRRLVIMAIEHHSDPSLGKMCLMKMMPWQASLMWRLGRSQRARPRTPPSQSKWRGWRPVLGFHGSGVSLPTTTVPYEICAWVHQRQLPCWNALRDDLRTP